MAFTAVFDACVLYPAPLRDLLMQLATTKLFQARWTEMIHDEWIRAARTHRPDIDPTKWTRLRSLMDAHVGDCLVRDFEPLIGAGMPGASGFCDIPYDYFHFPLTSS